MSKQKNTPKEVSFWLVKIPPKMLADLDSCRIKLGYNKKTFVFNALQDYLETSLNYLDALKRARGG